MSTTSEKITIPYINKYEKAQIIAQRARDIAEGGPICGLDIPIGSDPITIAKIEYNQARVPYKICRKYNTKEEIWSLKELNKL